MQVSPAQGKEMSPAIHSQRLKASVSTLFIRKSQKAFGMNIAGLVLG